jgi:hypothetical protein
MCVKLIFVFTLTRSLILKINLLVIFFLCQFCSDDKDTPSKPISKTYNKIVTTRVRPPVQEALPDALLNSSSFSLAPSEIDYSKTCQTNPGLGDACLEYEEGKRFRCIIKNRLFCPGPTEVLTLLDAVDSRLSDIEERSGQGLVSCLQTPPVDLSSQLKFPGDVELPSKYQCKDPSTGLGFGRDDSAWYVREAIGAVGQAFFIPDKGPLLGYIWMPSHDKTMEMSTGILKILADREAHVVEITGGGVGFGFCGLHMKTTKDFIYFNMNPDGVMNCDFKNTGTVDESDWVEICLEAGTLDEVSIENCESLKNFELNTIAREESTANDKTWGAAAPFERTLNRVELVDYLLDLYKKATQFEGVEEFMVEEAEPEVQAE